MKNHLFVLPPMALVLLCACETAEVPSVSISQPAEGTEFLTTATIPFVFDVDNFDLDEEAIGDEPEAGHGHIHLFLDNDELPLKTTASSTLNLDLSTLEITPGLHTFKAVLFENDHTIITDAGSDAVELNIAAP